MKEICRGLTYPSDIDPSRPPSSPDPPSVPQAARNLHAQEPPAPPQVQERVVRVRRRGRRCRHRGRPLQAPHHGRHRVAAQGQGPAPSSRGQLQVRAFPTTCLTVFNHIVRYSRSLFDLCIGRILLYISIFVALLCSFLCPTHHSPTLARSSTFALGALSSAVERSSMTSTPSGRS